MQLKGTWFKKGLMMLFTEAFSNTFLMLVYAISRSDECMRLMKHARHPVSTNHP